MALFRFMTNNQWKNDYNNDFWKEKGLDCSAYTRAEGFAQVFIDTKPDMVGLQEVSGNMVDFLIMHLQKKGVNDYALLWGKDTPILYRRDKFEIVDSDFFVYPENIPGYEGTFNNDRTKSWCLGVFRRKDNGKMFIFLSTHLWYMYDKKEDVNKLFSIDENGTYLKGSEAAREYQLDLAIKKVDEYIEKYNCPAIIVGDMNEMYTFPAVQSTLKKGFTHAYTLASEKTDEPGYHRLGAKCMDPYVKGSFEDSIDHILLKGFTESQVKKFDRYSPEYYLLLSDHSPAYVDIDF